MVLSVHKVKVFASQQYVGETEVQLHSFLTEAVTYARSGWFKPSDFGRWKIHSQTGLNYFSSPSQFSKAKTLLQRLVTSAGWHSSVFRQLSGTSYKCRYLNYAFRNTQGSSTCDHKSVTKIGPASRSDANTCAYFRTRRWWADAGTKEFSNRRFLIALYFPSYVGFKNF